MGADYLELDIVLTRDGVAIVFHDLYLDAMTNVATLFPERSRDDGKYYVADFSFAEVSQLSLNERINPSTGEARRPGRFPSTFGLFRIPSFEQVLQLVRGLNHSGTRSMGVYVELKSPGWHIKHQLDITTTVIGLLHEYGYQNVEDRAFIQSFDAKTLQQIHREQLTELRLIQLIGENRWWPDSTTDYDYLKTPAGLREVASYAVGIGPWYGQIIVGRDQSGKPRYSQLVANAHAAGLLVHSYTVRADALPGGVTELNQLLRELVVEQKVDGLFTDHPDLLRVYVDAKDN